MEGVRRRCLFVLCVAGMLLFWTGCPTHPKAPSGAPPVGPGASFRFLRQETFSDRGHDYHCDVSFDGAQITFASTISGNPDIFVKDVVGKAIMQKTLHEGADITPSFSPDGEKIAFASDRSGNFDIYVMNTLEGTAKQRVTFGQSEDWWPTWSPDRKRIAYCSFSSVSNSWEIWIADLETGSHTYLTAGLCPRWAPEEDLIAFMRRQELVGGVYRGNSAIYTIDSMGKVETQIVASREWSAITPCWSPEGDMLAFASTATRAADPHPGKLYEANDIWIVKLNGTGLTQITTHKGNDWAPAWGEDPEDFPQTRIFFTSDRQKVDNIWSAVPQILELGAD